MAVGIKNIWGKPVENPLENLFDFIKFLDANSLKIHQIKDGIIYFGCPKGFMTDEIMAAFRRHKPKILEEIKYRPSLLAHDPPPPVIPTKIGIPGCCVECQYESVFRGDLWWSDPQRRPVFEWVCKERCKKVQKNTLRWTEPFRKGHPNWWDCYKYYLTRPEWKLRREKILARDPICTACGEEPSVQVHHLHYEHVFNEPLFDLVGVCVSCHDAITKMDRASRKGGR